MVTSIDEATLKELFKTAMVEVLNEHRDLVKDIVEEAMEDIALTRAIDEGLRSESVSREEVMAILEGGR
jgi:hypothetical protein